MAKACALQPQDCENANYFLIVWLRACKMDELAHPTPIQPFWLTVSAHANIVIIWQRIERATMVIALGLRRDRAALHTIIPIAPLLSVQTQSAIQSAKETD